MKLTLTLLLALGPVVVAINIKAMYEVWKFKAVIFAFFLALVVAGKAL